jgi:hypothetical protein
MHRSTALARLQGVSSSWFVTGCFALAFASCSKSNTASNETIAMCRANSTTSCTAPSGCRGIQICQADGSFSSCDCASDPNAPLLGGPCTDNATCPDGAFCLLPTSTEWLGGGAPQGLCVADCSANIDLCKGYSGAECVSSLRSAGETPKRALCMPTCNLSVGNKQAFTCNSVPSSACEPLDNTPGIVEGYCRPLCKFDSECTTGHCDRQFAVCVTQSPPATLAGFGDSCKNTSECDGTCLHLGGNGICTNRCIYGYADQYGEDITECGLEGAPAFAGVCLYAATPAPGNLGYCTPLCDCNDDCLASGFVCRAFSTAGDAGTTSVLGHRGMCVAAQDGNGYVSPGTPCGS